MTKRTFKEFSIRELNWWINTRDYATEIQDKQFTSLVNWNFEGNKIVSSKWMQVKYTNNLAGKINWILIDGQNVYYAHWWKIYKNWVESVITTWILPNKKCYISVWWDIVFFTFDDWLTAPMYLTWWVLTTVAWIGLPKYNIIYNGKWILGWYWNDNIYFSETWTPTNKPAIYTFSAYSAGSQSVWWDSRWVISWFNVWENWLYVFKENAVYYSNTEKDTWVDFNFVFRKITSNGAIWQSAITNVDQEVFYYDGIHNAVRRLWYERNLTTIRDVAISREIETTLQQLAWNQSFATSTFKYPNYKLFLRSDLVWDWINDLCFTYNVFNKSWTTETNKDCSVSERGYLGSWYEATIYNDDVTDSILDVWVIADWFSKEYSFWDVVDYKKYWECEIAWEIEDWVDLIFSVFTDWVEMDTITINRTSSPTPSLGTKDLWSWLLWWSSSVKSLLPFKERIDLYDSGQNFTFRIYKQWIGSVAISNVNIKWKPDLAFTSY